MKKTAKKQMKQYTMVVKLCEGVNDRRFSFDAENDECADVIAFRWSHYHGMYSRDIWAVPATAHEAEHCMHNEYIR